MASYAQAFLCLTGAQNESPLQARYSSDLMARAKAASCTSLMILITLSGIVNWPWQACKAAGSAKLPTYGKLSA